MTKSSNSAKRVLWANNNEIVDSNNKTDKIVKNSYKIS